MLFGLVVLAVAPAHALDLRLELAKIVFKSLSYRTRPYATRRRMGDIGHPVSGLLCRLRPRLAQMELVVRLVQPLLRLIPWLLLLDFPSFLLSSSIRLHLLLLGGFLLLPPFRRPLWLIIIANAFLAFPHPHTLNLHLSLLRMFVKLPSRTTTRRQIWGVGVPSPSSP